MRKLNRLKVNWAANLAAMATGVFFLSFNGCSTGLFKPVQPWHSSNSNINEVQPPSQTLTNPIAATPSNSSNTATTELANAQSTNQTSQSGSGESNAAGSQSRYAMHTEANDSAVIADEGGAVSAVQTIQPSYDQRGRLITNPETIQVTPPNNPSVNPTTPKKLYFGNENSSSAEAQENVEPNDRATTFYRSQSPQENVFIPSDGSDGSYVQPAQYPEIQNQLQGDPTPNSPFLSPSIDVGSPNETNPLVPPNAPSGSVTFPLNYTDLDIYVSETETGRINIGGAYNSDSGVVGQFVIDERNFDITRFPRNFREIVDGTAWRGAGQNFRLELVPGSDVERYLVSFSEPYLLGSNVSFSSSLYLFQRQFFDYDEQRLGGRFAFGYRLAPDLSVSTGIRLENVDISDPRVNTSPQLNGVLGDSDLYIGNVSLIRDTRDHPFLPTEGNFTSLTFSQGFGEFDYSRGDLDFRTYRLMYQRPDGSGRHTLSYGTKLGFSGSQTPVFENYFAGGFSTLRGFDFRGASPQEGDVRVGGEFQWLNTIEYIFPLTADDMVKGVLFTDFGTVEENIEINSDNFRVAPGFGFRVHLPAAGIGAPLAFDFAFPVSDAAGDDKETFSFYLGVSR